MPKAKLVRHDTELPEVAQTAHIGLLVLKATGCNTWKVLVETPEVHHRVRLTETQQELINTYPHVVQYLSTAPLCTVLMCPECRRWVLTTKNPGRNAKCNLMVGCEGLMLYVSTMQAKAKAEEV